MSSNTEVLSHWSTLIQDFNYSPQQFYQYVTEAIERRKIPNAKIDRTQFHESHVLSAKREYLRINCKSDFYFAVCAAPFGTAFFISYWQLQPPDGCLVALFSPFPVLSSIAKAMVKPWTYYRVDTVTMFQTATHSAVLEVVDSITSTAQGVRQLLDSERKPVMKEFFNHA